MTGKKKCSTFSLSWLVSEGISTYCPPHPSNFPSVITALHALAVKPSIGERYSAMRTSIARSERFAVIRPPQRQWNFQQHRLRQVPTPYFRTARRRIPKIPQESRRAALRFLYAFAFLSMLFKLY